ncbi:hypothetical protein [Sphingomonas sp.]|uniref:hypothetical protein n=1 Tax=Sphingomonas sp. TaxID=28214 RepID=UPI001D790D1E|nr:hypothetical protein [Sphingomonas sp.]MBX9797055.1 hypothetical protein [Sphingomonas sp.]
MKRLVIVYNANAGMVAGVMDSVHKLVSPATYPCQLCAVTYGLARMRREWRAFLAELDMPLLFHHRPDFRATFPQAADWPLPLVAVEADGELTTLVSAADFAAIPDLATLIATMRARLGMAAAGPDAPKSD